MHSVPLPIQLLQLAREHPWQLVAGRARQRLADALPALEDGLDRLPDAVFGLSSGFFYLPAAINIEWSAGLAEGELLEALALGHCYFALQDQVIDEGGAPPLLCLASHEALLSYLDLCADFLGDHAAVRELHRRHYRTYTQALAVELAHRERSQDWTAAQILGLGGKAAPGNVVLEILAIRAGRASSIAPLLGAVGALCAAFQLLDDLNDVERDLRDGGATVPIHLLKKRLAAAGLEASDLGSYDAALAATGATAAVHSAAEALLKRSYEVATVARCEVVRDLAQVWLERSRNQTAALSQAIGEFLAAHTGPAPT